MYRDNDVTETHPLSNQISALRKSSSVSVTEMKLLSLSKDDVEDMIMSKLRLTRRLVTGLADIVHKKTSGHALFIVQFCNALIRDGYIAYSPLIHRYDWDESKISSLKTWDSVASLIVSNLSHLKAKALQSLRILPCFGIQSNISLIKLLDNSIVVPLGGIEPILKSLVEQGVLEKQSRLLCLLMILFSNMSMRIFPWKNGSSCNMI